MLTGMTPRSGRSPRGGLRRFTDSLKSKETLPQRTASSARSAVHILLRTQSRSSCLMFTKNATTAAILSRAALRPAAWSFTITVSSRTLIMARTPQAESYATLLILSVFTYLAIRMTPPRLVPRAAVSRRLSQWLTRLCRFLRFARSLRESGYKRSARSLTRTTLLPMKAKRI